MNMLELKRPLVFFDLETTGIDVATDRIIQIAVVRLEKTPHVDNFTRTEEMWLVNPVVTIPEAATAIHGITNEDVADMPTFAEVSEEIAWWFRDSDVCGHNVIRFDIPLLENEMKRAGNDFHVYGGVIDTLRIFQARFRHTLECAHRLYAGTWFEGAHDAGNDTDALVAILDGMLKEHPDMPREPGEIASTPPSPDYIDAEGKFIWVSGEAVFSFGGKTKGRMLKEVAKNDRGFLQWMLSQDFDATTKAIASDALVGEFPVCKEELDG